MVEVKFKVAESDAKPEAKEKFYRTMEDHYEQLLGEGVSGAAWFRHRANEARRALGGKEDENVQPFRTRPAALDDTYSLFSGNQALARKNLQLDKRSFRCRRGPTRRGRKSMSIRLPGSPSPRWIGRLTTKTRIRKSTRWRRQFPPEPARCNIRRRFSVADRAGG